MNHSHTMNGVSRLALLSLGWLSLAIGLIGIFVPLLPTTPFVLITACCFSRASKPLHNWLLGTKFFGPLIINWEKHGVITTKTKWLTTSMMVPLISYPIFFRSFPLILKIFAALCCACVLTFIWTRPAKPT